MKLNRITLIIITALLICTNAIAATDVYTWKSSNGNIVLSEKKPTNENIEYTVRSIEPPTVVQTNHKISDNVKTPIKINEADIVKLKTSELAQKNNAALTETSQQILDVKITSPQDGISIFTKEETIPVRTNPALSKDDKPVFLVNGSQSRGILVNGGWNIPRPLPGPTTIEVAGTTADGTQIHSTNSVTIQSRNGWAAQTINNAGG